LRGVVLELAARLIDALRVIHCDFVAHIVGSGE
jgi:hypothetical protein